MISGVDVNVPANGKRTFPFKNKDTGTNGATLKKL